MLPVQHIDGLLAEHHGRVSPVVLGLLVAVSITLISPSIILAQTDTQGPGPDSPPATTYNQPGGYYQVPQMPTFDQGQMGPGSGPSGQPGPMMPPSGQYGPNQGPNMGPPQGQYGPDSGGRGSSGPSSGEMDAQRQKMEAEGFKRMLSGMRGMETNIKMFQKQIDKLKKQNINVPSETTEKMEKLNSIIKAVKESGNFEDAQKAGMDDLGELIQSLNEDRGTLERLARWPQTIKQANRMLTTLTRSLKQDKTIAAKLQKSGYDVSEMVSSFEASIEKLKASRDSATELVKTDPEAAFTELEDNFFGNFDEVMQSDKTFKELGALSRFGTSFKRNVAEATKQIQKLKAQKMDTSNLEEILQELKDKGEEISSLMKVKPIDTDAVVSSFEELDSIRQDFESAMNDVSGDDMPWEKGTAQFKQINSINMNQFMPQGPQF